MNRGGCNNPFAPGLGGGQAELSGDPRTIDGLFLSFQQAYTFLDTTSYGPLIHPNFVFVYRDYDAGYDKSWGRDDEMRTTYGLFRNAQKLDLVWGETISSYAWEDSTGLNTNVVRSFNLTLVFNPADVEHIHGYANMTLERAQASDPWRIINWRDESNF